MQTTRLFLTRSSLATSLALAVLGAAALLQTQTARATDYTWTGLSTNGVWGQSTNWSPVATFPLTASDTVTFSGTPSITSTYLGGGDRTVGSITFDQLDSVITIRNYSADATSGGTTRSLTLGSASVAPAITVNDSATNTGVVTHEIGLNGGNVVLASNLTVNVNSALSGGTQTSLTISRPITGGYGLTKVGSGLLTLQGGTSINNTYTGKTAINAGRVRIYSGAGLGANPASFVADQLTLNGGSLYANGVTDFGNRGITLGVNGGGFIANASGGSMTINVPITGVGGLTQENFGTGYTLTLSATNTYTGQTIVPLGTLQLGANGALPASSNVRLESGTLNMGGFTNTAGTLTVVSNATITLGTGRLSFANSAAISWDGNLTLTGTLGATTLRFGTDASALTVAQLARIIYGTNEMYLTTNGYLAVLAVDTIRVETAADGSGTVVPAQALQVGQSITVYAIARDTNGVFLANVPAVWGVTNATGFVSATDLTPSADTRSAVFSAGGSGSGQIVAQGNAPALVPSGTLTVNGAPEFSATRPFIWAKASDRQGIIDKIATNAWATSLFNQLIARAAWNLSSYESDQDAYLRKIPVNWTATPPVFPATGSVSSALKGRLEAAQDCAVIYYLTGNPRYARLAADVLHNIIQSLNNDINSAGQGGWAYAAPDGNLFLEAREVAKQAPIIYDFLHGYLQSNQVWDVALGSLTNFSFTNAQAVFDKYQTIIGQYNGNGSNHTAFMKTAFVHNILALDDAITRSNLLNSVVDVDTSGPLNSFETYLGILDGEAPYADWPESSQYAAVAVNWTIEQLMVVERCAPERQVFSRFANFPGSYHRLLQMNFPNNKQRLAHGDGYHSGSGLGYATMEMIYHIAKQAGVANLTDYYGGMLNHQIANAGYTRSTLFDDDAGLRQLLWSEPVITEAPAYPANLQDFRTDTFPVLGIALQRNLSPNGDPDYGLMSFVGGAGYVHSHQSGMNMELYGMGQALGVKSTGKDTYDRTFASHNTVIVNGYSRGYGGWKDYAINTVQVEAMEPAARQSAVSSNISFTCNSFLDDKGDGAEADQQRTMAIIRTSPTTGYYVDIFRSDSQLTNEYHDYVYHNIGESLSVNDLGGAALSLSSQPTRFTNDVDIVYWGDKQSPGWGDWTSVMASATFTNAVRAQFTTQVTGKPVIYMDLHIPGGNDREYATAKGPANFGDDGGIPAPYNTIYRKIPTLAVRKYGSAWNDPFAVVFEPHGGATNSGSVQSVAKLVSGGAVVGLKVQSLVNGSNVTHYVISFPTANGVFIDPITGIEFTGRFAVITDRGAGSGELYIGEGSSLSYKGRQVKSVSGGNTQASVLYNAGGVISTNANAPVTVTSGQPVYTIVAADAVFNLPYAGQLTDYTINPPAGSNWVFAKVSGPAWLSVASTGTLSGTPATSNQGLNSFEVSVSDGASPAVPVTLQITVDPPPVTLATTNGSGGISGVVQRGDNSGTFPATSLNLRPSHNTYTRKAYIRFDVSSLPATVKQARLQLVVSDITATIGNNDQTVKVYGLTDQSLDAWNPATTKWSTAPGNLTTSNENMDPAKMVLLGTIVLDYNGDKAALVGSVVNFSSPALDDFLNADTNGLVTFALTRFDDGSADGYVVFAGETHATLAGPKLAYTPVVAPVVAPAFTQISRQANGAVSLTVTGALGQAYTLWGRTNLTAGGWTVLTNGTLTTSPLVISATGTNVVQFYRLSAP